MLDANVHAMLRRTEEATARAVATAESAISPARSAGLTRAVQRVTRLAGHVHTGRVHEVHYVSYPALLPTIQAAVPTSEHLEAERDVMRRVLQGAQEQLSKRVPLDDQLDEALRDAGEEYKSALGAVGMPAATVALLESWLELQVLTRIVQLQGDPMPNELASAAKAAARQEARVPTPDLDQAVPVPTRPAADAPLSAIELGQLLGVSDQTVRGRERAGELFSILRPGRRRGVEYPGFQAWPEIAGAPLTKILQALTPSQRGRPSGTLAYSFFSSRSELLGGLAPLEVITGQAWDEYNLNEDRKALLSAPTSTRLEAVERAARTLLAVDEA